MAKMVQVPITFLEDTHRLLDALKGYGLDNDTKMLCNALEGVLVEKEAAIKKRENFSAYKNAAAGTDERERHRKEYLENAGIGLEWQTKKETPL